MRRIIVIAVATALVAVACGGGSSVFALEVGDCFDDPGDPEVQEIATVDTVSCDEPHDNEVYANLTMPDGPYPGDDRVADWATKNCLRAFEGYVGIPYEDSRLDIGWLTPTQDSWENADDRTVACILFDARFAKLDRSMRDAAE